MFGNCQAFHAEDEMNLFHHSRSFRDSRGPFPQGPRLPLEELGSYHTKSSDGGKYIDGL